jgi:hypothetical protein
MQTLASTSPAGFAPKPLSSRVFIRCYRHYGEAKQAYDELRVVAGIPDRRMTVVARGLEWREPVSHGALLKVLSGAGAALGALVGLMLWLLGFGGANGDWASQTLFAAAVGALAGAAAGVVVARVRDRRRGLAQTGHVEPHQYDILVEEQLAPKARDVLCPD